MTFYERVFDNMTILWSVGLLYLTISLTQSEKLNGGMASVIRFRQISMRLYYLRTHGTTKFWNPQKMSYLAESTVVDISSKQSSVFDSLGYFSLFDEVSTSSNR